MLKMMIRVYIPGPSHLQYQDTHGHVHIRFNEVGKIVRPKLHTGTFFNVEGGQFSPMKSSPHQGESRNISKAKRTGMRFPRVSVKVPGVPGLLFILNCPVSFIQGRLKGVMGNQLSKLDTYRG